MKKSFWQTVYLSFKKTGGHIIAFLGLAITTAAFYFHATQKISISILIPIFAIIVIIVFTLFDAVISLLNSFNFILPKIKLSCPVPQIIPKAIALLLVGESPIFGHEMIVSIYLKHGEYEVLIGLGYVFNIQEDKLIQIAVVKDLQQDVSLWGKINQNNKEILANLIIKPGSGFKYFMEEE